MTTATRELSPEAVDRLLAELEDAEADARRLEGQLERLRKAHATAERERDAALREATAADEDATAAWKECERLKRRAGEM